MVVGDDDLEPTSSRFGDLVDGRDPAIDGEQKPDAVVREAAESLARDAVPLFEAARQVPVDVGAELAEEEDGERRGTDPVDVVVAVHADAHPARNGGADALDRDLHVSEQKRVVSRERRVEEPRCRLGRVVSAPYEDGRRDVVDAEVTRERARCAGIDRFDRPRARHAR